MRVLVVSNDRRTASAICRSLHGAPGREILSLVNGRIQWGDPRRAWEPHLILIREPGPRSRRRRIAEARRTWPNSLIVLLADTADRHELVNLVTADVDAVVSACAGSKAVGVLIEAIAAGHIYSPVRRPATRSETPVPSGHGLTSRELQILQLAANGLANGQIAAQLGVCAPTVKFHLSNVYRKLGLTNRTAAALYAHRWQLVGTEHAPEPSGIAA